MGRTANDRNNIIATAQTGDAAAVSALKEVGGDHQHASHLSSRMRLGALMWPDTTSDQSTCPAPMTADYIAV